MKFYVGEKINLVVGRPKKVVAVKILELNPETGMPSKMKAVRRSERLGKIGFIQEGDDWVKGEYQVCRN